MAKSRRQRKRGSPPAAPPPAARRALPGLGGGWLSAPRLALVLALLIALCYAPVFTADYVWDDKIFQEEAPAIQEFTGIADIWLNPRRIKQEAHYWPIVYSTFWLEHQLWGFSSLGSHLVNLLLHLAVCLLLWRLLARLAVPGAWLAAAVFALHPVHVEAVAWVIARKDLLASVFYLLAIGAWLDWRQARRGGSYLALLLLFAAGMLSKSLTITLPAALLALAWWQAGRLRQRDLVETAPLFLLGFAIAAGDLAFYHDRAIIDFTYAWAERPIIAAKALWFYAGKLLWPYPLVPVYPKWDVNPRDWLNWLPLVAGLLLLAGLWLARQRTGRGLLAGLLLFALALSPTLGLGINVFMLFSFAADRYQYLASAALIALLVAAVHRWQAAGAVAEDRGWAGAFLPGLGPSGRALALALLTGYGALTFRQTLVYQDDAAFWSHVVARNPAAHSGFYNLGLALVDQGQVQEGINAYRKALEQDAESPGTHINLSFALLQQERFEEAAAVAQRAAELDPDALLAHQNLASALHRLGRLEGAYAALTRVAALMKKPTAEHSYHLGHIALLLERTQEAEAHLLQALALDPDYKEARQELLSAYLEAGRYGKARRLVPQLEATLAQTAYGHYSEGRFEQALGLYRHLAALGPESAYAQANLGSALAQTGRYQEAIASFERALALDPQHEGARANIQLARDQLGAAP